VRWNKSLLDLTLALGALGATACTAGTPICDANPDPCCSEPSSQGCLDSKAQKAVCATAGGTYALQVGCVWPDAGILYYTDGGAPLHVEVDAGRPDGGLTDGG
jgi:hypothetical protein